MNSLLERFFRQMPHYYPQEMDGYRFDIRPASRWRRVGKLLHCESPLYAGKKVELVITITQISSNINNSLDRKLWTTYPQESDRRPTLGENITLPKHNYLSAFPVTRTGSFVIEAQKTQSISPQPFLDFDSRTLFDADIQHGDIVFRDVMLVILGSILGAIFTFIISVVVIVIKFPTLWEILIKP